MWPSSAGRLGALSGSQMQPNWGHGAQHTAAQTSRCGSFSRLSRTRSLFAVFLPDNEAPRAIRGRQVNQRGAAPSRQGPVQGVGRDWLTAHRTINQPVGRNPSSLNQSRVLALGRGAPVVANSSYGHVSRAIPRSKCWMSPIRYIKARAPHLWGEKGFYRTALAGQQNDRQNSDWRWSSFGRPLGLEAPRSLAQTKRTPYGRDATRGGGPGGD